MADWTRLDDEALLDVRIRDLGLKLPGTELETRIQTLQRELTDRGVTFHPHCYLGDEWFTPDDETSLSVPFYLAHPRLIQLEKSMMMEAEGESPEECLKLLRHETGHVMAHAYRFTRKRSWREVFGDPRQTYNPDVYKPRPYSRTFVINLENWYAQSHPEEDFAETFAVWLNPAQDWRAQYKGWGALAKLEYVDRLMAGVRGHPPPVASRRKICEAARLQQKLRTYYQRKRALYVEEFPDFFDSDLKRIFDASATGGEGEKASLFISRQSRPLARALVGWSKARKYTIDRLLKNFKNRCNLLKLHRTRSESETLLDITVYLTTLATNYLHTGTFKIHGR